MATQAPPSIRSLSFTLEQVGIYCWDLRKDLVQADTPIAELFGIDPDELARGLPIATVLLRIHEEDRPRVARSIHEAITCEQQYSDEHRIIRPDGSVRRIMSIGRCFRDENDLPSHLTGIIFADLGELAEGGEEVESTLRVASYRASHALAKSANDARVEMALEQALMELGESVPAEDKPRLLC